MTAYRWNRAFAGWIWIVFLVGCDGCQSKPKQQSVKLMPILTDEIIQRHNAAVALMGQFEYAKAYDKLDDLARNYPNWVDVHVDLAIATLNRRQPGDAQAAMRLLEEAVKTDPENLRAYYCQGILALDHGDTETALDAFATVAEKDPQDAYAVYYLGQCLSQVSRIEEAMSRFQQAIKLDPYLQSGYYGLFQTLMRQGRVQEANQYREQFEKLTDNPQSRLAEIKYTRMGPKAMVTALQLPGTEKPKRLEGSLFDDLQMVELSSRFSFSANTDSSSLTACDVDHNSEIDLFVTKAVSVNGQMRNLLLLQKNGEWQVDNTHPIVNVPNVNAALWGDYDNDGLTDVYLCRSGPNQLWRQSAANQWVDVTESTQTSGGDADTRDGAMVDADHDGDLDLFLVNHGANELLNNNLDGTFRSLAKEYGLAMDANSRSVLFADLDNDRDLDIVVQNQDAAHEVYFNDRLWNYHVAGGFENFKSAEFDTLLAADTNADGQVELITVGSGGIHRWLPNKEDTWKKMAIMDTPMPNSKLAIADVRGDGRLELLVSTNGRFSIVDASSSRSEEIELADVQNWLLTTLSEKGPSIIALREDGIGVAGPGSARFPFITLTFSGKEDKGNQMRSNRSGIGVDVAVRVGTQWTAFTTIKHQTGPGQSLQPVQIGLGESENLDFVQMTWPDGVFQTELGRQSSKIYPIQETQRQVASCPVIFAWNGDQFEFVTDTLGVGGIGFNVGNGEYGVPRPWENLILSPEHFQPKGGRYEIRVGEPMEEACYLDSGRLIAYDLPKNWRMVLDERHAINGPTPSGRPIYFQQYVEPIRASNDRGQSVLSAIQKTDYVAAEPGVEDSRFLGRTAEHFVHLEFNQPLDEWNSVLVFDGWIEYPYSQTMFAAWQANATYDAPTIEAQGNDGEWRLIWKQFGYMAGMPRRSAITLPKEKLPEGTKHLRISTNLEIYWDRFFVVDAKEAGNVSIAELPLVDGRVAESGFAMRSTFGQKRPYYDYQRRSPFWDTRHMTGYYTEFGDALPLLRHVDDAVAIIGPGEEVQLSFGADLPNVPNGHHRHFVLTLYGWAKDKDLYTKDGDTLTPLPTRIDSEAGNPQRDELHRRFNTRFRVGH